MTATAATKPEPLETDVSKMIPWLAIAGAGYYFIHKYLGAKTMKETYQELEETRAARDAAVATASQTFKLVESLGAIEKLLRGKLKNVEDALKKERDGSMEKFHKDFEARQNLEKANEDWKHKHADLEARLGAIDEVLVENKRLRAQIHKRDSEVAAAAQLFRWTLDIGLANGKGRDKCVETIRGWLAGISSPPASKKKR
jgi:hypothetical protein